MSVSFFDTLIGAFHYKSYTSIIFIIYNFKYSQINNGNEVFQKSDWHLFDAMQ